VLRAVERLPDTVGFALAVLHHAARLAAVHGQLAAPAADPPPVDHPAGPPAWPAPAQTELAVQVTADRLGVYPATVRLGPAKLSDDGWQPMLAPPTIGQLLVDLARLGDETAQLAALGWTLRPASGGGLELVEPNLPAELIDRVDGRFRLPRACGFRVVGDLPPLAQLYRSLTMLHAYANGPTNQLVAPADLLAQVGVAARSLGHFLGALLALGFDPDAVQAQLTRVQELNGGGPGAHPDVVADCAVADGDADETDVAGAVDAVFGEMLRAAIDMVTPEVGADSGDDADPATGPSGEMSDDR